MDDYVFDVLESATDAMGEAADDLQDCKLCIPKSLELAFELRKVEMVFEPCNPSLEEIIGPTDQVEEIIGEYVHQFQVASQGTISTVSSTSYYYNSSRPMIVVSSDEEEMDADEFQYPSIQVSNEA
ncbi:hypothetical protein PM082_011891 [Marasmius tenuissimus]|nr:hypothetical protein PM082_011891 [Marasmius tenuissimus]